MSYRTTRHARGRVRWPSSRVPLNRVTPSRRRAAGAPRIPDRVEVGGGKVSLSGAKVVVVGGRGVGCAEGFGQLEELAGLLGGAVGCSRVVTSNGWRPHTDQIGQ